MDSDVAVFVHGRPIAGIDHHRGDRSFDDRGAAEFRSGPHLIEIIDSRWHELFVFLEVNIALALERSGAVRLSIPARL